MATFKKGQSFKDQRVHISADFDQRAPMKGKNVVISISNDTREGDDIKTDPMLVYQRYKDKQGAEAVSYTASYSESQYNAMMAAANHDGDKPVLIADLFPNKRGDGLVVNTNTLRTPDVPFDAEKHREVTEAARADKKAAREAKNAEREAANEAAASEASAEAEEKPLEA